MPGLLFFIAFSTLFAIFSVFKFLNPSQRGTLAAYYFSEPGPLIERIGRFEWYRLNANVEWKNLSPAQNVSILSAYEFPYEISISLTSYDFSGHKVYCRYVDEKGLEIGDSDLRFEFPNYIVNCRKRKNATKIGLSVEKTADFQSKPLIDRTRNAKKYDLAMCLSPLYGDEPKWLLFIEAIEHYKLQGVQHFYVYLFNVSAYDAHVIDGYVKSGEVEVHWLGPPDNRPDFHWQLPHIADCLLRSREATWTIFGDLDEKFLPQQHATLRQLLDGLIVNDPQIGAVRFRQQFVLKSERMPEKFENLEQVTSWLPILRWNLTTGVTGRGYASKCIIRSEKVMRMDIHDVGVFYPDENAYVYDVPSEMGVIRHYRDQFLGNWSNTYLQRLIRDYGPVEITSYPENVRGVLVENVIKRVKSIFRK